MFRFLDSREIRGRSSIRPAEYQAYPYIHRNAQQYLRRRTASLPNRPSSPHQTGGFLLQWGSGRETVQQSDQFLKLGVRASTRRCVEFGLVPILGGPQMSALPTVIVGHEGGLRIQFGQREGRKKRRMRRTWRSCSRLSRIGWCRGRIASVSSSCRSESAASSACRGRYSFEDREVDIENKIHTFCL